MFALQTENASLKHNLVAGVPRRVLCYCSFVEDGNFFLKSFTKVTSCFIAARPVCGFLMGDIPTPIQNFYLQQSRFKVQFRHLSRGKRSKWSCKRSCGARSRGRCRT